MPSAAAIRPAVEPAMASGPAYDGTDPVRQIIKTVENKIRNLDKRKSKLESYQELRISGKNLTADQQVAVSKYDEVVQWLLCASEFLKQIQGISVVYEKEQKNVQRKETAARVANEVFKVRETLILQDIIGQLRHPDVRRDFEEGTNGAVQLDAEAWPWIDKLLAEGYVSMAESTTEDAYTTHAQRAADHWVSTVDGKPKQFSPGCTYEALRKVVRSVQDCGYFQKKFHAPVPAEDVCQPTEETNVPEPVTEDQAQAPLDDAEIGERAVCDSAETECSNDLPNPRPTTVNDEAIPASDHPIPVLENDTTTTTTGPVFVNAFAQAHLPPFIPPMMPDPHALPEELQTGAFSFLQDSELDDSNGHADRLAAPSPNAAMPQPAPTTVPPANLMLINPMMAMGQSIPLEQLVVNGATNGTAGGVTPPMFPFPFQAAAAAVAAATTTTTVAQERMPLANGNVHPSQGQVPMPGLPISAAHPIESVSFTKHPEIPAEMVESTPKNIADPVVHGPTKDAELVGNTETMTISDWNPVAKGKAYNQQPRENSTDSNGDRRDRRDDRRPVNGNGGGYSNGSRRRYPANNERGSNGANANYNGSRGHPRGNDGESPMSSANYRNGGGGGGGGANRPSMNRVSNGGGGGGGTPTNGNGGSSGTFYRNNDPSYYGNNGMKGGRQNNYGRRSSPPNGGGVRN